MKNSPVITWPVATMLAACMSLPLQARNLRVSLGHGNRSVFVLSGGEIRLLNSNPPQFLSPSEVVTLLDHNGGDLRNGDDVSIKTSSGHFFVAIDGGPGALRADRERPGPWEMFKIVRVEQIPVNPSRDPVLRSGESITLKSSNGYMIGVDENTANLSVQHGNIGPANTFKLFIWGLPKLSRLSGPFTFPQAVIPVPVGVDANSPPRANIPECSNPVLGNNFPNCYAGHTGTDFGFAGHFPGMNLGSIEVVAAAPGRVVAIGEGNPDRCYFRMPPPPPDARPEEFVICPGAPAGQTNANFVTVLQDDGLLADYYHLKRGSVAVQIGTYVRCGELVGKLGSSGISTAPHLHFQLRHIPENATFPSAPAEFAGARGVVVDPYVEKLWTRDLGRIPVNVCSAPGTSGNLGQRCGNLNSCRPGLLCQDSVCKIVGVPPGGDCDSNQLCGPGLSCMTGKCTLRIR